MYVTFGRGGSRDFEKKTHREQDYAISNQITNSKNLDGMFQKKKKKKKKKKTYTLSHIVQITDFRDFLFKYCEEKSKTFTEF